MTNKCNSVAKPHALSSLEKFPGLESYRVSFLKKLNSFFYLYTWWQILFHFPYVFDDNNFLLETSLIFPIPYVIPVQKHLVDSFWYDMDGKPSDFFLVSRA